MNNKNEQKPPSALAPRCRHHQICSKSEPTKKEKDNSMTLLLRACRNLEPLQLAMQLLTQAPLQQLTDKRKPQNPALSLCSLHSVAANRKETHEEIQEELMLAAVRFSVPMSPQLRIIQEFPEAEREGTE